VDIKMILTTLRRHAGRVPSLIDQIDREVARITERMTALRKAGLIYASPYWREKKYFYLIHPTTTEGRKREYVGTDTAKIEQATAAIERATEYDLLHAQREQKLRELSHIEIQLGHVLARFDSMVTTRRDRAGRGVTKAAAREW